MQFGLLHSTVQQNLCLTNLFWINSHFDYLPGGNLATGVNCLCICELLGVDGFGVGVEIVDGIDDWAGGATAPGISGKFLFFQMGNFLPGRVSFCSVLSASILAN